MLNRIHQKLGTAGFIISIVALVAALGGGAYAASGGLSGKQKKEVEKIAKKVATPGPAGATGATGPAGAPGAKGDAGAAGANGTNGTNGTNGKSVTVVKINEGTSGCEERGGALVKQEGPGPGVEVCNGAGAEGGGFPETLPSEATEKGVWHFVSAGNVEEFAPISFAIPLSEVDAETITVSLLQPGQVSAGCVGSSEEPKAEPGFLCAYSSEFGSSKFGAPNAAYKPLAKKEEEEEGVVSSGALLYYENTVAGNYFSGSFAIAAP
jgi:hypothetical protein